MIKKYKKKPVVIEAIQLTQSTMQESYKWIGSNVNLSFATDGTYINIKTLEGTMAAHVGDYIVKGIEGEFYPCKASIFERSYEEVK